MSDLLVQVAKVRERARPFRLEASEAWWGQHRELFRDPESGLLDPFVLDLEGYCLGQRLFFRGDVAGTVELPCGRCVEPYPHRFADRVELLLEPLPTTDAALDGLPEGGIRLDPEDLEIGRYAGDELDFGVVLREVLLFNWPMQPRCEEGCLGLCPSCGANRNRESCECEGASQNRPFAALGELLQKSK